MNCVDTAKYPLVDSLSCHFLEQLLQLGCVHLGQVLRPDLLGKKLKANELPHSIHTPRIIFLLFIFIRALIPISHSD